MDKNPKDFFVIEKDERLVEYLNKKFGSKIKIHNEDMMKFSYKNFYNKKLIIFGNLPYNISTQIFTKWIKIQKLDKIFVKISLNVSERSCR